MAAPPTTAVLTAVLREHPDVAERLDACRAAAWSTVDPVLLELCRLRVAQLLGADFELAVRTPESVAAGLPEAKVQHLAAWPTAPSFTDAERACLDLCEQFVIDVASVTPAQTGAVAAALGDQGLADFVSALLVVEQRQRLRLAWMRLFPEVAGGA